jgi:hypothetical protein
LEKLDEIHQYVLQNIDCSKEMDELLLYSIKFLFKHGNLVLLYDSQFENILGN